MHDVTYYQKLATRATRLSKQGMLPQDVVETLKKMAQDYEEIADDLITGAIEVRHPELMPQRRKNDDS